jgi:hypothetical protein
MSYANDKETVLTIETFKFWAASVNGNKTAMRCNGWDKGTPLYHLNEATGTKTEITRYEFFYHPYKLDATVDEIMNPANADEVIENPQPNNVATAIYYAKAGHKIIEHCMVGK